MGRMACGEGRPVAAWWGRGAAAAVALGLASGPAMAGSGFTLRTQSASTLGAAQSGMAAAAEDASALAFNPAAIGFGHGTEVVGGIGGVALTGRFRNGEASTILGTPITGNSGGDSGTLAALPSLYATTDLAPGLRAGIGVTSTFGLGVYWRDGWIGRYYGLNSQLQTVDLLPTLSWRPHPAVTLGIGVDIQYARLKTSASLDYGTLDQAAFGGALGGTPGGSDGRARTLTDSVAAALSLGMILEPLAGTRVGISGRTAMTQRTTGNATFEPGQIGAGVTALTGAFTNTSIRSALNLPATVIFGVQQAVGERWHLMASAQWQGWNRLRGISTQYDNPAQASTATAVNWRDSWYVAAGARWQVLDALALRFGVGLDTTPSRDWNRQPALPNAKSVWTGIGLSYRMSERLVLDLAYGHIFSEPGQIQQVTSTPGNTFRGNLSGKYTGSVDFLSVQAAYRF